MLIALFHILLTTIHLLSSLHFLMSVVLPAISVSPRAFPYSSFYHPPLSPHSQSPPSPERSAQSVSSLPRPSPCMLFFSLDSISTVTLTLTLTPIPSFHPHPLFAFLSLSFRSQKTSFSHSAFLRLSPIVGLRTATPIFESILNNTSKQNEILRLNPKPFSRPTDYPSDRPTDRPTD